MPSLSAIDRAKNMNRIISIISDVLSLYGYSEIFLPIYEYYDVLADKTFNFKDENIIRFIDRNTGKSLVLRPDFTPQVCRIVANYLSDMPLPIRLSYSGRVFRNVGIHKGMKSEKYQVGGELFGADEESGDLELLLIVKRVMNRLKIDNYKIVIGDKRFLNILSNFIDIQPLLKILESKNYSEMEIYLKNLPQDSGIYDLISYLPDAFGGLGVLDNIHSLSNFSETLKERVLYLKGIIEKFIEMGGDIDKVVFDVSETRGLNYYTGINFDIISIDNGNLLGGGGRYDKLMEKFGYGITAAGVAFNVEEILSLIGVDKYIDENMVFIDQEKSIKVAEKLRDESVKVFFK
ncbi:MULTISPECIES: ATP phosphoribosyltransferase regulatory subunit [Calditerrivibrio]|uniref:ATP phosphoribosyltransferase regulatory subunit n=1 Tax=Calditerrivibrio nitroreducens TaxID=477976 RepID=A0A2J6WLV3_9BACT|nr:MAG: ATP phosphoribosyltransferase regulatory subunit [Calditerrivibrio nitroreducens]